MNRIYNAKWIKAIKNMNPHVAEFSRDFSLHANILKAELSVTALGVFYAEINGAPVSTDVLAPGWTSYEHRIQYMTYDVTSLLKLENEITVGVGRGWRFHRVKSNLGGIIAPDEPALLCALRVVYSDGSEEEILSDENWSVRKSRTVYNDIYNGETFDAQKRRGKAYNTVCISVSKSLLLPLEGEPIRENERFSNPRVIKTPRGETVLDFGQEITGYVEVNVHGSCGDKITIRHFEVLDADGNVYTENLRSALQTVTVICSGKKFVYKPKYTFYGFRYICVDGINDIDPTDFTAIAVYSDMKRTGYFECSEPLLNKLYSNILWGQRGNFLDIPTDCPQRDERLGWTGDAQVFCRSAAINYDVGKFFKKWLADLAAEQTESGQIPNTCPVSRFETGYSSAAWGDAAVIVPWQMYLAYGKKENLAKAYPMMKKYVDYMAHCCEKNAVGTDSEFVHPWRKTNHYGDWLAPGRDERSAEFIEEENGMIATAYLAYDLDILIKTSQILGLDPSFYEKLYEDTVGFFRKQYMSGGRTVQNTQTAATLALYFRLTDNAKETAAELAELVEKDGKLTTGFVGTAYLLHALTLAGRDDLAADLLLRREYPSWLYPVTMGATTVWERWNGIFPDGSFEDKGMNSFNHYAYGAVLDWMFCRLGGINPDENEPGYRHIKFRPAPDKRIQYVNCGIITAFGRVGCEYKFENGVWKFVFSVPEECTADALIFGKPFMLHSGLNIVATE